MVTRTEIKEFFDIFCEVNETDSFYYSYYFFLTDILMNKQKKVYSIYDKNNDALFLYYYFQGKYAYPFIPLIKSKVDYNYNSILKDFIKKIGENAKKIIYVPYNIEKKINFKLSKFDTNYFYDTENFMNLKGKDNKPIRRYYNVFERNYPNVVFREVKNSDHDSITKLFKYWKDNSKERLFRICDTTANRNWLSLVNSEEFEQHKYVLEDNGKIISVVGLYKPYPNSKRWDLWCIKTDFWKYEGISEYFVTKTFRELFEKGIKLVNYAGEVGQKGLRNFKIKMNPCKITTELSLML